MSDKELGRYVKRNFWSMVITGVVALVWWQGRDLNREVGELQVSCDSLDARVGELSDEFGRLSDKISEVDARLVRIDVGLRLLAEKAGVNLEPLIGSLAEDQPMGLFVLTPKAHEVDGKWYTNVYMIDPNRKSLGRFTVPLNSPQDPDFIKSITTTANQIDPGAFSFSDFTIQTADASPLANTWIACSFALPDAPNDAMQEFAKALNAEVGYPVASVQREYPSTFNELIDYLESSNLLVEPDGQ